MTRISHEELGLPKAVVGWIYNHATRNYWRVAGWYDLDDLIQDGLVVAYKCREKYGSDLDPPHFMTLVKTAFFRHIAELLRRSRPDQELVSRAGDLAGGVMSETEYLDRAAEPEAPNQDLAALVASMPSALRKAVRFYLSHPEKMLGSGSDETDARRLKRMAGFPVRHDFEVELRAYLWESTHDVDVVGPVLDLVRRSLPRGFVRLAELGSTSGASNIDAEVAQAIRDLVIA